VLPYQQAVSNKISRLLTKYNIKAVHVPKKKNRQLLRTVKDDLGLKIPGVYCIPCECGKAYIGQTGRSVEARCKEHMRHGSISRRNLRWRNTASTQGIRLFQHLSVGQSIGIHRPPRQEAIQIRLNHKNFNRDSGFTLSRAWNPATKLLFKHDIDPGKAATEPAHRPVA
jgi:hypothetical protein